MYRYQLLNAKTVLEGFKETEVLPVCNQKAFMEKQNRLKQQTVIFSRVMKRLSVISTRKQTHSIVYGLDIAQQLKNILTVLEG